jgi:hypothetical protein
VANAKALFEAAKRPGVRRVIYVSITNPERRSDLPYFRGKAATTVVGVVLIGRFAAAAAKGERPDPFRD